jgi:hypothetical protein
MEVVQDNRPTRITVYVAKFLAVLPLLAALSMMAYVGDVRENNAARARPPSKTAPIKWTVRDRGQRRILYTTIGFHVGAAIMFCLTMLQAQTFSMSRSGWMILFAGCYVVGIGLGGLMWYWTPR